MFRNGTLFMIAGGTFCLWGHWEGFQAQRSASWPSVDGTVVSSKVRSKSSGSGTNRGTTYEAEVRYQYQVDGAAYENDVQRFGQISMGWKSGAQADVRRHSRGPDTVYYDSAKPATSVLEPGLHWALCLKPAVGSLFFTVGVVMFRGRKYSRPLLSRDP
jgi:hypothetical protein